VPPLLTPGAAVVGVAAADPADVGDTGPAVCAKPVTSSAAVPPAKHNSSEHWRQVSRKPHHSCRCLRACAPGLAQAVSMPMSWALSLFVTIPPS
jgi:hypothetical protein